MLSIKSILDQFEVRLKSKPKFKLLDRFVFGIAYLYSFIKRDNSFYNRYITVLGNRLYVPDEQFDLYKEPDKDRQLVLRHEYCHLLQSKQERWYKLKYIFSSKYRLLYELEAHCHQLAGYRDYAGRFADLETILRIRSQFFYGSIYHFHIPFKFKLSNEQKKEWDNAMSRLIDKCNKECSDHFTALYLRDYGRLPSSTFKRLERDIEHALEGI